MVDWKNYNLKASLNKYLQYYFWSIWLFYYWEISIVVIKYLLFKALEASKFTWEVTSYKYHLLNLGNKVSKADTPFANEGGFKCQWQSVTLERLMLLRAASSGIFTAERFFLQLSRDECEQCEEHVDRSSRTCSPLTSLDIHHSSSVFLSEVFEQNHVVLFIGIIDEDSLSPHTQHLMNGHTALSKCHNGSDESWLKMACHKFIQAYIMCVRARTCNIFVHTSGNPTSTSKVKRLVLLSFCGNCWMQWSVKAATTAHHWEEMFRFRKMSATEHAQSRPIRLL